MKLLAALAALALLLRRPPILVLIGATTENPYFALVSPLLSRCLLLRLEPLQDGDVRALLERALAPGQDLTALRSSAAGAGATRRTPFR